MVISKIKMLGTFGVTAAAVGGLVYQYRNSSGPVSSSATLDLCAYCLCHVRLQNIQQAVAAEARACQSDLVVTLHCFSVDYARLLGRDSVAAHRTGVFQ